MKSIHLSDKDIARFWSKVDRREPDDCWLWSGWKGKFGHGRFDVGVNKILAHQLALILDGQPRPLPPRDNALHGDCSNPACVNPKHLRWGTKAENTADRDRLGRRILVARGEANGNSKLTDDIVRDIRAADGSQRAIGRRFGISQAVISMIKRGELWTHVD